jgi:hypothetical protein
VGVKQPYQSHSDTSREAAEAIEYRAQALEKTVYQLFVQAGWSGLTDSEVGDLVGGMAHSHRPRRIALVQKGLVVATNWTRRTQSGRQATVWVVKELGPVNPVVRDTCRDVSILRQRIKILEMENNELRARLGSGKRVSRNPGQMDLT